MKTIKIKLLSYLAALTLLIAPSVMGDTTVTGEYDPAIDVPAVQAAVNAGGVVTLQGNFDFGDEGEVVIWDSVEIVGEDAIIENGLNTFLVLNYPLLGDVIIRDITLVNPQSAGIGVISCNSLLVQRVTISGAELFENQKFGIRAEVNPWTWIWVPDPPPGHWQNEPNVFIKKIHVIDCDIDLGTYDSDTEEGRCIYVWGLGWPGDEVDILIRGNTVRNCSREGIHATDIAGTALIEDNLIITGDKASAPGDSAPIGIATSQTTTGWFNPEYGSDFAQVAIVNNSIEAGPNSWSDKLPIGIYADKREGLIIKKNSIKTYGGWADILFGWGTNDSFIIEKNKLTGSGQDCTIIFASATNGIIKNNNLKNSTPINVHIYSGYTENNIFVGNNTTGQILTYFFDEFSENNTVRGHTGGADSAIDLGTDNSLTGITPMADAGGIGQQMSQAMQELHERLNQGGIGPSNLP